MLLGDVVTGRKQIAYHADNNLRASPGYDSVSINPPPISSTHTNLLKVQAATKAQGGEVNYIENIVYREDAILPGALVMYKRMG